MMENNLNELAEACHKNSHSKGFWDEYDRIMKQVEFAKDSEGQFVFDPSEVTSIKRAFSNQRLMEVTSELGEALEADRSGKVARWDEYSQALNLMAKDFDKDHFEVLIKDSRGDELADAIIRILQQCAGEGINIGKHVEHKMKFNSLRPRLHGKKH